MKIYNITHNLSLKGDNLDDAIEKGFPGIIQHLGIGNAAGYRLYAVWYEFDTSKQAVVLHIVASGSDGLVNYDPAKDMPKEYTLRIPASQEECPKRVDVNLKGNDPFDPFDDACLSGPDAMHGALIAIVDEIGAHHCKIKVESISFALSLRFRNLHSVKFAEQCISQLHRNLPDGDKMTAVLMARVYELYSRILGCVESDFLSSHIFEAKTRIYLRGYGKVSALAKIREEKGITQQQLADNTQMSVQQLQAYEACPSSTLWSSSHLVPRRLADALGVKVSDIVDANGAAIFVVA